MRRTWYVVAAMLAAAVLVALPGTARAAGAPVITSPSPGAAHYAGFNGPFTVDFSSAPVPTMYDVYIDQVPPGGGAPVQIGSTQPYSWYVGQYPTPQFTFSALPPGTGYAFHVTDHVDPEVVLGFTVLAGPPPTCSILLPSRVRMKAPSYLVHASLSAECAKLHTSYASWQVRHSSGAFAQTFVFDHGATTDTWRIYDDERTGVYHVRPSIGRANNGTTDVPLNTTQLAMRRDSRLAFSSSRSGSVVTLSATATRYSPSANRRVAWAKRAVTISYRTCSTCAWHRLGVRTTDRYGRISLRVRSGARKQYRATAAGTSTTWSPYPRYLHR